MWQEIFHKKRLKTAQVQAPYYLIILRDTNDICVPKDEWLDRFCTMYFLTQSTQSVDFASIQLRGAENLPETI